MMWGMTEYDTARLAELGRRRRRLRTDLAKVNGELTEEIPKALEAQVAQAEIVRLTGMTRESVVQFTLPADERWKKSKRGSEPSTK